MTKKSHLRQQCIERRQSLDLAQKTIFSQRIQQHLEHFIRTFFTHQSLDILCYQSLPSEVSTADIFHQAPHHYYAPVTHQSGHMHWQYITPETQWQTGSFHISEPMHGHVWKPSKTPALLISPLVGFDTAGNRIGMGKGCFDRWLATHQDDIDCIIGLAFSCQTCSHIPVEPHDIPLHTIITEEGYISCQNNT